MAKVRRIRKSDGAQERFSKRKLTASLTDAGVATKEAREIVERVSRASRVGSTDDVHKRVVRELKKRKNPALREYSMKRALVELGPSGYPFEQFVARLLQAKGYRVSTNRVIKGACVDHETDVLAVKGKKHFIFECKFHNRVAYKSDIQTVLYMKARWDDIIARWERYEKEKHLHKVWIVTNTQFTKQAKEYAACQGIGLMSWYYPAGKSLADLVRETGVHPVTALSTLSHRQKKQLVQKGVVLCDDLLKNPKILNRVQMNPNKRRRVLAQAEALCRG